ncbi:MAG: ATP-binding protein [Roseburia sp.]|nr:ATP-binding protein [Roseburia sp.]
MRNVIQDVMGNLSLILGAWIIAYQMPKRKLFAARLALSLCVVSLLRHAYFYFVKPYILTYPLEGKYTLQMINTVGYVLLILMVVGAVFFLFEGGFWPSLFCGGASYCIQHVGQRLYRILSVTVLAGLPEPLHILTYVSIMTVCLTLAGVLVRKMRIDKIVVDNKKLLLAVLAVVATAIALDLVFMRAMREGEGELLNLCFTAYSVMTSTLIFLLMLGLISSKRTELELDTIKAMLESEQEQYYFEKSLIDTINIKCHDLKHQIALLEGPAQQGLGEELKAAVNAYDSSFHTGNIALDVVLTRENFNCGGKDISMTCIADGRCLDFISEADIYSLFGNILDNAIEAAEKVPEPEKRIISLHIAQEGYFVSIHAENYFADKLTFVNGLPESTKGDSVYHGFGMKSIKMLVNKYGGSLKVYTKEERFILDIMFSL